jgi:hypothetical protein
MSRLVAAALLIACAAPGAGAAGVGSGLPGDAGSPAHCTNYSTGADIQTDCAPPASAPPGSAFACHNYTVGSDTHTVCAAVATPGLSGLRERKSLSILPAPALRCYTYHIGSSVYTDCR